MSPNARINRVSVLNTMALLAKCLTHLRRLFVLWSMVPRADHPTTRKLEGATHTIVNC